MFINPKFPVFYEIKQTDNHDLAITCIYRTIYGSELHTKQHLNCIITRRGDFMIQRCESKAICIRLIRIMRIKQQSDT